MSPPFFSSSRQMLIAFHFIPIGHMARAYAYPHCVLKFTHNRVKVLTGMSDQDIMGQAYITANLDKGEVFESLTSSYIQATVHLLFSLLNSSHSTPTRHWLSGL